MSARPRLLFVAPWFLFPANTGGRIRSRDVLRGLKGGRFEITLLSPEPPDEALRDELPSVCDRFVGWRPPRRGPAFPIVRLRHLVSSLPVPVASDGWPPARRAIAAELARRPDVAVIDFVHTAILTPSRIDVPSVLFTHNVEAEIFKRHADVARNPLMRAMWRQQWAKMTRFERATLARFDRAIAVSDRDKAFFEEHYGAANVSVIPTGVDLDYFGAAVHDPDGDTAEEDTLVFTGSMDWMPNIDAITHFMDSIWPLIAARHPQMKVTVVGRSPPRRLVETARQRQLPWTFTGRVPDVRPYVHAAKVYMIPLRIGGGTRLKVFEAMAMNCPVVSTSIGVEGLPLDEDRHYVRADTPQAFADAVVDLMRDEARRRRLAAEARAHVNANFSARAVARIFESICMRTAGMPEEEGALPRHAAARADETRTGEAAVPQAPSA